MMPGRECVPPAFVERLLMWLLDAPGSDQAIGDLRERFRSARLESGSRAARRWYWVQVAGFMWRVPVAKLADQLHRFMPLLAARPDSPPSAQPMTSFFQDLRFAARSLRSQPGFVLLATATLALGIGAYASMYTVVHGVLLRPLPFAAPDQLMTVSETFKQWQTITPSPSNYLEWKARTDVFESLEGFAPVSVNLAADERPELVAGAQVTAGFFGLFGVAPVHGRTFVDEDSAAGATPVIVLGHELWQTRLGGEPDIVGQQVRIDGVENTVIGVMPESFRLDYVGSQRYWIPGLMSLPAAQPDAQTYRFHWVQVLGRLAPEVSRERASAELNRVAEELGHETPDWNEGWGVNLVPLHELTVGNVRATLVLMLAAVGFLLLVTCANVSNLMLARGTARHREVALRLAVGAAVARVRRQLVAEAMLLSLAGGAMGLALSGVMTRALLAVEPGNLPRTESIGLDPVVGAVVLGLALLTGAVLGLVPALRLGDRDVEVMLRQTSGRTGGSARARSIRVALVAAEAALVFVLLVGAGLMIGSLRSLERIDPGYRAEGGLAFGLSFADAKYPTTAAVAAALGELEQAIGALPGVESVGMTTALPLTGGSMYFPTHVEGRDPDEADSQEPSLLEGVTPGYLPALGLDLVDGRWLTAADGTGAPLVGIVNETLAARYFGEGDVLGGQFRYLPENRGDLVTIVGVVRNAKHISLTGPANPTMYVPFAQLDPDLPPNSRASLRVRI